MFPATAGAHPRRPGLSPSAAAFFQRSERWPRRQPTRWRRCRLMEPWCQWRHLHDQDSLACPRRDRGKYWPTTTRAPSAARCSPTRCACASTGARAPTRSRTRAATTACSCSRTARVWTREAARWWSSTSHRRRRCHRPRGKTAATRWWWRHPSVRHHFTASSLRSCSHARHASLSSSLVLPPPLDSLARALVSAA